MKKTLQALGEKAQIAARKMAVAGTNSKDEALAAMAAALVSQSDSIIEANKKDLALAKEKNITMAMLDRLMLNEQRIYEMAEGLKALISLPDPIGETVTMWKRPNGLEIGQVRVPLGVVGIIYEARPNVTTDATGLALKTGNAVILRGGSEAFHSNQAIVEVLRKALANTAIPLDAVQLVPYTDREAATILMRMNRYIDVLIPRGGAGLIKTVIENSTVPVIETGTGNCHVYVDKNADYNMAVEIIINAKTQRPAVCNAMETLLVHQAEASSFLPIIEKELLARNVELRACPESMKYLTSAIPAQEEDWQTEYLDLILAVKIVDNIDSAIDHISRYGTKHSEAIVTPDYARARKFLAEVDAAAVYINASTRFTDGNQFGLGAEMGISTQKLHARGPMGLKALTSIKHVIYGNGQIRE